MPIITIQMWEGRSREDKKKLSEDITDVVCKDAGCPKEAVIVVFQDIPKENWAQSGKLASE